MRGGGSRARGLASMGLGFAVALSLSCPPAHAEPPQRSAGGPEVRRLTPGVLRVSSPPSAAGTLLLYWDGTIAPPMAAQITQAFEAFRTSRRRIVLALNTGGGSVAEGERVIEVLRRIRITHQLDTTVGPGGRCGSMCLPIFLQGQNRFGARASSWLFHEITRPGVQFGRHKRVEGSYRRLIDAYWKPAGVSQTWIDQMLTQTDNHDWWQTGHDLIVGKSGIITRPIENRRARNLEMDTETKPDADKPVSAARQQLREKTTRPPAVPRAPQAPTSLSSSQQATPGPSPAGPTAEGPDQRPQRRE
jgi:ATP-dependent protease ClpP protease subunit